jgi:hypothetical protein
MGAVSPWLEKTGLRAFLFCNSLLLIFVISETHISISLLFLISYARSSCLWSITDSLFPLFISHSVLFIGRESDITKEEIGNFSMPVLIDVVYATKGIHDMSLKVCFHYSSRSYSCSYFEFMFSYSFAALKYRLFVYFVWLIHTSTEIFYLIISYW